MPNPILREVPLAPLVTRAAGLETRIKVRVLAGPDIIFPADPDQLEQMFINLVRNAADAVLESPPNGAPGAPSAASSCLDPEPVVVRWDADEQDVTLTIEDNGPGLMNPSNVFTPFYTTKPNGSGVGLVLSRQIAEAHGGRIEIGNRPGGRGCAVKVVLPRSPSREALISRKL
jgi:signal transduction histidine kinase